METKKINYFDLSIQDIKAIKDKYRDTKPKILVHVCCGVCSCFPLLFLENLFDITVYYANSNIYPESEFNRRLDALNKYVEFLNAKFEYKVKVVVDKYNHEEFLPVLNRYKDEKEGGKRCKYCIARRLVKTFEYAKNNGYQYVTTVMTVSPNKDVKLINELGEKIAAQYKDVNFIHCDFKKNNGQLIGNKISKKLELYRQCYCGCEYSIYESEN